MTEPGKLLFWELHFCDILCGMVILQIRAVAERHGITTTYQLQKAAQLHPGHAAKLWKGEAEMIGLKTIDTLCEALACEPGHLFARNSDTKKGGRK